VSFVVDQNGKYYGETGHAAIFMRWQNMIDGQVSMVVLDQWSGTKLQLRTLSYNTFKIDTVTTRVNNWNYFSTIRW